jgi:hypothetical protein
MLMVTETTEPMTTTKRMAFSESPNQSTAMGSQQMLGRLCKLTKRPPRVCSRNLLVAIPKPRTMPMITDSA